MKSDHCIWIFFSCNPKVVVSFYRLVLWSHFLLSFWLMGLSTYFLTPLHNIRIFLLCVQLFSLFLLVILVVYQVVSFSENMCHLSVLTLDMVDSVAWLVSCDGISVKLSLHIRALICLHNFLYNYISLLYHSITFPPNPLWSSYNTSSVHSSDDLRALV